MPRLPHPMTPIRMRSLAPKLRRTVLASTPRGATSETAPAAVIDARNSRRDRGGMLIVRLLADLGLCSAAERRSDTVSLHADKAAPPGDSLRIVQVRLPDGRQRGRGIGQGAGSARPASC